PATVTHSYSALGSYQATLTLVDTRGNLSSVSHNVVVGMVPTAAFGFSPAHPLSSSPVSFDGSGSTDPSAGGTLSYAWTFGDGATGTGATPSHSYGTPGIYTVTLTVTDSVTLNTGSISHQVTVGGTPTASF